MLHLLEAPVNLTSEEKDEIDNTLLEGDFPWFFSKYMIKEEDDQMYFFHYLYLRNDKNPTIESPPNSKYSLFYRNIFNRFCLENDIKVNVIRRGCLNLSLYTGYKESTIHLDHPEAPHNNFIMYLSDSPDYGTLIYDEDKKTVLHQSKGIKYNAVVFNGYYHSGIIPTVPNHARLVCVFTFN